jgi:hypothetical protein
VEDDVDIDSKTHSLKDTKASLKEANDFLSTVYSVYEKKSFS